MHLPGRGRGGKRRCEMPPVLPSCLLKSGWRIDTGASSCSSWLPPVSRDSHVGLGLLGTPLASHLDAPMERLAGRKSPPTLQPHRKPSPCPSTSFLKHTGAEDLPRERRSFAVTYSKCPGARRPSELPESEIRFGCLNSDAITGERLPLASPHSSAIRTRDQPDLQASGCFCSLGMRRLLGPTIAPVPNALFAKPYDEAHEAHDTRTVGRRVAEPIVGSF